MDTLVDGDGQPVRLVVEPTGGAHVAQADADWLWELIRNRHESRQCPHCVAGEIPGTGKECEVCVGSGRDPECLCHNTGEALREINRLKDALTDARSWARHGYELGQRSLSWTDAGVAPAWLTEGWPTHFPGDLVPTAGAAVAAPLVASRSYFAVCPSSKIQLTMTLDSDPGGDLSHLPSILTAESGLATDCICGEPHSMVEISAAAADWLREESGEPPAYRLVSASDVTWQWGCLLDADVAVTPVSEAAAWGRAAATGTPVVRRIVGPWEGAPAPEPPPVLPVLHLTATCKPGGSIDVHTTVAVPEGDPVPPPGATLTLPCSWDGRHSHDYTVDLLEAGRD